MKIYYVYTLAYPQSMGGAIFYVGKGTENRINVHEIEARHGYSSKKHNAIRSILDAGEQVVKSIVFETDNERVAYKRENELIKLHAPTLANVIANPLVVRIKTVLPSRPDPSSEEYFQMILQRAIWLNRGLAEKHPVEEREAFLVVANAESERYLRE